MSIIYGGQAGLHSVIFYNSDSKVKASRKKDGLIKVEVVPRSKRNITKLSMFLDKVPFVRGMWLMGEFILLNWRIYLTVLSLFFAMLMSQKFLNSETGSSTSSLFQLLFTLPYHFFFLVGILLCAALFIKFTEIGKYHSAEHMVDNAYEDSQDISLQNVKRNSRVHKHCGTNLLMFILVFYFLFYYLIDSKFLVGFLSFSFGYEVYRIDNAWIKKALTPIYAFSYFLQWLFFTSKPETKHLEVSIAAYQEIINLSKSSTDIE
jgi:uncharacterized protein YqhQ